MKKMIAALLALAMVFTFAACGKKSSLDSIKQAGKLVVMTNATFPPYEYTDGMTITGIDMELAQMIADEIGVELEIIDMNFDLLVEALSSSKGDLVAAGMSITDERSKAVDFSIPYVQTTLYVIVPLDSPITTLEDLEGKTIAVQENTTGDLFASDPETIPGANVLRFKSAVDAGNAVADGKADAAVIDEFTAGNIVANNTGKLILLDEPLTVEEYAMAVAKGNKDLLEIVNKVLQKAMEEGLIESLTEKHMNNSRQG